MKRPDEWRSADWIDPAYGPAASEDARVAVVIPSFRAAATIGAVLRAIGPEVKHIYVIDDGCPD
ncbi:MAG: hypothetical protein ABIW83_05945, partial [Allosphingosinicella sp.]